jgi:3-deoxy-D-manno-octulosonic acid kinase
MPRTPRPAEPPITGFVPMEDGRTRLLVRGGWEDAAAVVANAEGAVRAGIVAGGREAHAVVELPNGERAVLRRYRRGGLVRHFNRELYFGGNRAFDELRATERARAGGVRAPLVIAAVERPARLAGYRALLATLLIPGARDAAAFLADASEDERRAVLREAGRQVGLMHATGVAHPDLNLRNLLVAEEGGARVVYLLDFDRAQVSAGSVSPARRERDLRRLARSARKLRAPIAADDWAAFRDGYGEGWSPGVEFEEG